MDFHIFRNFFKVGENSRKYPNFQDGDQENEKHDIFFDDISERCNSFDRIFTHIEDMFNTMFPFSFRTFDLPKFGKEIPNEGSPRSLMLKDTDERDYSSPSIKEYKESTLLPYNVGEKIFDNSHNFSYSKFSSIKTVQLPDGTVEEHRTLIDSDGKKTVKVCRTIGDTSHEVITKSDKYGLKEKEENFINMDEKELPNFEKIWGNLKSNSDSHSATPSLSLSDSNPSYLAILKKFWGSSQKEDLKWL